MRVENPVNPGTPDVFYVVDGAGGWAELKYRRVPPTHSDTLLFPQFSGLHKTQVAWWLNFIYHRGRGVLFIGVGPWTYAMSPTEQILRNFNYLTLPDLAAYFTMVGSGMEELRRVL